MNQIATVIIAVLGTLAALVSLFFAVGLYAFFYIIKRRPFSELGDNHHSKMTPQRAEINEMRKVAMEAFKSIEKEVVEIKSFDNLTLRAFLIRTDKRPQNQKPRKVVICAHGYTSHPTREFSKITPFLRGLGYDLLLLNDRAHGDSEGKYTGMSILDRHDVIRWIDFAIKTFGEDCEIFLYGISMGAATVGLVSGMDIPRNIKGVVMDCGFSSAWIVLKHMMKVNAKFLPLFPTMHIVNFFCKRLANYDLKETTTLDAVRRAKVPFLFFHGTADNTVVVQMGRDLYDAVQTEKEIHIYEGLEHVGSYYFKQKEYEEAFKNFLERNSGEKAAQSQISA